MAAMIPEDIIEQVRQASDIVDILGQYVRLKKRGRNFLALCPFHNEKTPSFSVSPDKQIYHCFGCGKGGNVFTFLMEHENMSFVETVRFLAQKAGITIPERRIDSSAKEELERMHYAHRVALDYFKSMLQAPKYHRQMTKYLKEQRRLTDESIELFQLGLAGEEWEGFLNYALKKELFPNELAKAGLISYSEKHDKYFDRFRQRLMIPIFNLSGKPIAFGGRTLKKGEPAKYVNSPETMLYSKSNVLYGLNFSRQFIRERKEVIIVEGYFDLISLYQAGIKNVVASSGTAFTAQQARLLARFAEMAYLFFDADSAGQAAAMRSVDVLYDAGLEVMVMIPPEGEDPDSVAVKQGAGGIEKLKDDALRYLQFRVRNIDLKKQGIIAKEKLIKELAELAGRIGDATRRRLFVAEAAEVLQTDIQNFYDLLKTDRTARIGGISVKPPKKIDDIERDLLSLIINHPEYFDDVSDELMPEDFHTETYAGLYSRMLTLLKEKRTFSAGSLINYLDDDRLISELTLLAEIDWEKDKARLMIKDYLGKILNFKKERIIDRLKVELKVAEEQGDVDTARKLTEEISDLIKRRKE
ncbi:MAG TPA: DNA primase [candidate division Zixibacteria bacterium]|nr:DNA primase [candidate division Zixibacteria bacterium]